MDYTIIYSREKMSHSLTEVEASSETWTIGQVIDDRYEIEEILAQDQEKVIYKVRHLQWNISLAVRSQMRKAGQVRFFHQAERWVALAKHPNVVSAYYVQKIGGAPRLFVEYVPAQTLQLWMESHETRDVKTLLDIAIQVCWGMAHAHKHNMLHGDLRPGNMFITEDGEVKIADFRSREDESPTWPPYMAPEMFQENVPLQPAMDIFAFGVILYEFCCRHLPFAVPGQMRSLEAFVGIHSQTTVPSPLSLRSNIPSDLSDLLMQCLDLEPHDRPRNFDEIAEKLLDIYSRVTGFPYPREAPEEASLRAVDLNNRALSLLDLGRAEEAEEHLVQAVAAHPKCVGARINLSLLRLRRGKASLAIMRSETEPLLAIDEAVVSFYRAGVSLEHGGFLSEALAEVSQLQEKIPKNKELLRLKGLLQYRLRGYQESAEIFEAVVATEKPSVRDLYQLFLAYIGMGKKKKALEVLEKGVELSPHEICYAFGKGIVSALQGQLDEAQAAFQRVLKDAPHHFWALLHGAEIAAAFGDYLKAYTRATPNIELARQWYQQILAQAPHLPRAIRGYQYVYQAQPPVLAALDKGPCAQWSYASSLEGHAEGVHCLALSPDGRVVIAGGADQTLRIWDVESGRCRHTLQSHPEGTHQICMTQDGHFAVSIGRDNLPRVWDVVSGEHVATLQGHGRDVTCVTLSQAGGYAITGSQDKTLRIWDLGTNECLKILKGHTDKINCLAVTPDSRFVISGSEDGRVGLWDLDSGMNKGFWEGHHQGITCLAVSADGRYAVSGSWDQTLRIWDLTQGTCSAVLEEHRGTINCLAITANSQWVISGSEDKTLRIWELATGKRRYIFEGHTVAVTCTAVSADNRFAISGSWDQTLRIWDLAGGSCLATLEGHNDLVKCVAITPDERFILSGGDDPILRVWEDLTTRPSPPLPEPPLSYLLEQPRSRSSNLEGQRQVEKMIDSARALYEQGQVRETLETYRQIQEIEGFGRNSRILKTINDIAMEKSLARRGVRQLWQSRCLEGHGGAIECLAIAPDELTVVSGSRDHTLRIWELKSGECLQILKGHHRRITCTAISPNNRFVISGSRDNTLRLWEIETGRMIYTLEGHGHWVEHAHFTPDGRRLISGSRDNTLRIWELKTGQRIYTLPGHTDLISCLEITPDGKYAISGSHDRTLRIWEIDTGQCLHVLERHLEHIKCLAVTPDSKKLLSGSWDQTLWLWDLQSGEAERCFQGHQNWINAVYITSNGEVAISCSLDKTIRLWELASGRCLATLEGHTKDVSQVIITRDNRFLISSSWDKTIRLWDIETGQCLQILEGHTDWIPCLLATQDNRFILSGSRDNTIRLWEVDWKWELA